LAGHPAFAHPSEPSPVALAKVERAPCRFGLAMHGHHLAEERSIALHQEVAKRLRADPRQVAVARARVASWLRTGEVSSHYALRWQAILGLPLDDLCAFLVDPSREARDLRQCTPFAGVVDPRTRWRIWREVAERAGVSR
jgi:hypothetical protein